MELAPLAGTSFAPTLRAADAPSRHLRQVEEMNGHRGYYEDGWEIVTLHQPLTPFDDREWELYDLVHDPIELHDLAAERPEKVAELAARWEAAARRARSTPSTRAAPSSTWCGRRAARSTAGRCGSCGARPPWSAGGRCSSSGSGR